MNIILSTWLQTCHVQKLRKRAFLVKPLELVAELTWETFLSMKLAVFRMLSENVTPVLLKPEIFYKGLVVWLEASDIIALQLLAILLRQILWNMCWWETFRHKMHEKRITKFFIHYFLSRDDFPEQCVRICITEIEGFI